MKQTLPSPMNPFAERYKTLSNSELLRIIAAPADYQPLAVDAANAELATRQLTPEELLAANTENDALASRKELEVEKKIALENKVKNIGSSIAQAINPIQRMPFSGKRVIATLTILFSALFLFGLYNEFGLLKFMLFSNNARFGLGTLLYLGPIIILPAAVFLFWMRKKLGWILYCVYFSYSALSAMLLFYRMSVRHDEASVMIDGLLSLPYPISFMWNSLFFIGCLCVMFKKEILVIYNIDKKTIIQAIVLGVLLTAITIFGSR